MALEFAKTAPGVMTATWTHAKNGRAYSVAVIESCGTWHTFIDGELLAREQPTFEEAVAAAEQKLTRKATSPMIRVAGVLVLASMLGASAVVASKFMPALSPGEVAAVMSPSRGATTAGDALATALSAPAASAKAETGTTLASPPRTASSEPAATADPPPAPALATLVPDAAPHDTAPDARSRQAADRAARAAVGMQPSPPSGISPATGPRRFSAENNLLAIKEATTPSPAEVPSSEPITTPPASAPTAPAAPETAALDTGAPEAPGSLANAAPRVVPMDAPLPATAGDASLAAEPGGAHGNIELPPIPAPAPRLAGPDVKAAASKTTVAAVRERVGGSLTPALATADRAAPTNEPRRSEPRTSTKKAAARRTARPHRAINRPRPRRRETRKQDRRIQAAAPGRRLVCFAHVCRWR